MKKVILPYSNAHLTNIIIRKPWNQVKITSYNNMLIRNIISTEIDVVNLRTILRMIRDHVDSEEAQEFLIEGGKELTPGDIGSLYFPAFD